MKFSVEIDVPEETITNYQEWTVKNENNLNLNFFNISELEDLIKDIIEEQTQWDVINCTLLDKKDLKKIKEMFKT